MTTFAWYFGTLLIGFTIGEVVQGYDYSANIVIGHAFFGALFVGFAFGRKGLALFGWVSSECSGGQS